VTPLVYFLIRSMVMSPSSSAFTVRRFFSPWHPLPCPPMYRTLITCITICTTLFCLLYPQCSFSVPVAHLSHRSSKRNRVLYQRRACVVVRGVISAEGETVGIVDVGFDEPCLLGALNSGTVDASFRELLVGSLGFVIASVARRTFNARYAGRCPCLSEVE
jgi:hypothetical protein